MRKIPLLFLFIFCLSLIQGWAYGTNPVVATSWTTTTNPATARAGLSVYSISQVDSLVAGGGGTNIGTAIYTNTTEIAGKINSSGTGIGTNTSHLVTTNDFSIATNTLWLVLSNTGQSVISLSNSLTVVSNANLVTSNYAQTGLIDLTNRFVWQGQSNTVFQATLTGLQTDSNFTTVSRLVSSNYVPLTQLESSNFVTATVTNGLLAATNGVAKNLLISSGNGGGLTNIPIFFQEVGSLGNTMANSLSVQYYGTNRVITDWPAFSATTATLTDFFPVTNSLSSIGTQPQGIKPPSPMFQITNGCQLVFTNTVAGNPVIRFINVAGTINFRQTNSGSASREIRFRLVKISDIEQPPEIKEYPLNRSVCKASILNNTPACISFNSIMAVQTGERIMIQASMGSLSSVIVHDINLAITSAY